MATFVLVNNVKVGQNVKFAGEIIDDVQEDAVAIAAAGGRLFPTGTAAVDTAATQARTLKARGALAEDSTEGSDLITVAIDADQETRLAALGGLTLQVAGGTFASGTATIAAGITVTADTDAFVVMSAVITGSVNVGGVAHLKASNTPGAPGVGAVTLNVLGADGAVDADAAGDFRVLLVN